MSTSTQIKIGHTDHRLKFSQSSTRNEMNEIRNILGYFDNKSGFGLRMNKEKLQLPFLYIFSPYICYV